MIVQWCSSFARRRLSMLNRRVRKASRQAVNIQMGMGMKSLKWEGIGTKNLFPHTCTVKSQAFTIRPENTKGTRFTREGTLGRDARYTCVPNNLC